jgi:hypothetical protein
MKKLLGVAAIVVLLGAGAANASTLNGTFNIDIYQYDAGGIQSNADATAANVTSHSSNFLKTITYTGDIDFDSHTGDVGNLLDFLQSASGSILPNTIGLNVDLSSGAGSGDSAFGLTTLFDISGTLGSGSGTISHDDGVSIYDDGSLVLNSSAPTTVITNGFSFSGGAFRLIYAAANGDPSVLNIDFVANPPVSSVPLPATLPLFATGLGALGFAGWRKRKKAKAA